MPPKHVTLLCPRAVIWLQIHDDILNDDSINVVVEVMGGTDDAKDVIYAALKKGKNVVTANKALIAGCMPETEDLSEHD
jgi:homoserine dehydrogenase